jgi:hypothetical protein
MTSKQLKHALFNKEQRTYWKNLYINIDSFCDKWDEVFLLDFKKKLKLLDNEDLEQFCKYYKIHYKTTRELEQKLLGNFAVCIEIYCYIRFALDHNPKVICQLLGIPIRNKTVDKRKVIMAVFQHQIDGNLPELLLRLLEHKSGAGYYNFIFNSTLTDSDYGKIERLIKPLVSTLKRHDKKNKIFHYRQSFKGEKKWIFLLIKETTDSIFPAIPDNTRVLKGEYIFVTIIPEENKLIVNTRTQNIAYEIRNYLQRRIENQIYHRRESTSYSPSKFFDSVLEAESSTDISVLKLVDVKFRTSEIDSSLTITDQLHKNDLATQLKTLRDKKLIKLEDFSEFQYMSFYYKGIQFRVNIEMNKWGSFKLHLLDRNKPIEELYDFKRDFEILFDLPFDTYLKNIDSKVDEKRISRHILGKKTLEAGLPDSVEDILLNLIKYKIIQKPSKTSKRKCTNTSCRKYTWEPGDCPICGNELRIEGDYIDLKYDKKGIIRFVINILRSNKDFSVLQTKKQIKNAKFDIIELMDNEGNPLSIYISHSTVSDKIVNYYKETGNPLMIILSKFRSALQNDIESHGFECVDLAELFSYRDEIEIVKRRFGEYIMLQKKKWQSKILYKGLSSFQSILNKKNNYSDQDFEIDIYNMLHEMFIVGDRLGGKFTGVAAPDGIVSVHNGTSRLRYCLAWDCKYSNSRKGYQLADKASKHRKYINDLKKNGKVLFYGGLKTYAIISQNMDFKKYETFYSNLIFRFRWKGNIIYIAENQIIEIYQFFKDNSEIIIVNPTGFYNPLHRLLLKIYKRDSIPYPHISKVRLLRFFDEVKSNYSDKKLKFDFNRGEF